MSLAVLAVITAAIAGVLMWKRKSWRRTQAVLMFITGLGLSGIAGRVRDGITDLATSASASGTAKVFGVGVPYAIALVLVLWFALDMDVDGLAAKVRGRSGGANKHTTTAVTPWLALLVPVALAALPLLGSLPEAARHGATQLAAMIG